MKRICNIDNIKQNIVYLSAVMGLAFVLGIIMSELILFFAQSGDDNLTTFPLAFTMTMIGGIGFMSFIGCLSMSGRFELAVCMSKTRKYFIIQELIESLINGALVLIYGAIAYKLDLFIQEIINKDIPMEMEVPMFMDMLLKNPMNWIVFVVAISMFRYMFGAAYIKVGKGFLWVIWFIWMVICLVPSKVEHLLEKKNITIDTSVIENLADLCGGYFIHFVILIISVLFFVVAVGIIKGQEARGY